MIESKRLFVNVSEQMEGRNGNVGAGETALQQAPEVFHAVGVDVAFDAPPPRAARVNRRARAAWGLAVKIAGLTRGKPRFLRIRVSMVF